MISLSLKQIVIVIVALSLVAFFWLSQLQTTSMNIKNTQTQAAKQIVYDEDNKKPSFLSGEQSFSTSRIVEKQDANDDNGISSEHVSVKSATVNNADKGMTEGQRSNTSLEEIMLKQNGISSDLSLARSDMDRFQIEKQQLVEEFVQLGGTLNGDGDLIIYDTVAESVRAQLQGIIDTVASIATQIEFARLRTQNLEQDLKHVEDQLQVLQ